VLQAGALGRRRDAGERLEAAVDLQRVGGHGDRPVPPLAQAIGEGDGQRSLPHARRSEDREHGRFRNGHRRRSMVSVVSVRIGCGLSTSADPRVAAIEASQQAREVLDGAHADVALVFACGAHLGVPEATLEGVRESLVPGVLAGCGAGGVVGAKREVERGTGVAVWAAALGDGSAEAFHLDVVEGPDVMAVTGLPDLEHATAVLLLPDPYSFPTDLVLADLARRAPGVPVLGGIASARTLDGEAALFLDDHLCGNGAVGVIFSGVEVLPCVSQGAAPVGPELTVTAADGHIVRELAGRPALEALRDAIAALEPAEQALVASGLLLGIVIDGGKPEYGQGDFLVRGVIGADP
jgi:small ligand-binding sensory domain FIST